MNKFNFIALFLVATVFFGAVYGDEPATSQILKQLQAENQQLRERLKAIEDSLSRLQSTETNVTQVSSQPQPEPQSSSVKLNSSKLKINGRLMFDWDNFDAAHNESNGGDYGSQSEIRRARIAVTSQLNKNWKSKLQVDYNDAKQQASLKDAYIQRKGGSSTLTIGKQKEPMGMEQQASSKYIASIERSMVSDALAPDRNIGITLKGGDKHFSWAGGIFDAGVDGSNDNQQTYSFTGRLTYAPTNQVGQLLHVGLGASYRDLGGNDYQINQRAEVHTADKIVFSGTTVADAMTIVNLELATVNGAFSTQAEYFRANVSAQTGLDSSYDGYYVLGSYFLTGESRPYKKGVFGKVKPNSTDGAWELIAKYSVLNASDNGVGVDANNIVLGVNYYLNPSMRLMANYISTDLNSAQLLAEDRGDAVSVRLQYIF